jgi:prophage antirepressor-like protein
MCFEDMAAAAQDPKNLPIEFEFDTTLVRMVAKEGQAWFVAKDVCDILGIDNPSQAVSRLDDDQKGITNTYTTAGTRELLTVNESDLYSLIFTSRKPEAKRFRKWVTNEVLPAIRQTGRYVGYSEKDPDPIIVWSKAPRRPTIRRHHQGVRHRLPDRRPHKPVRLPRPQPPRALLHGDGPLLLLAGPARAGLRSALVAT